MRILILAVHFEVTGARYIADAFKRLNHDVRHIGPQRSLKDAWGVDVDEKYIWKSDVLPLGWKPDLVIVGDTEITNYLTPDSEAPVVVWSNDSHVRNMRHVKADHYFLSHAHGPAQPVIHDDESWLPCGADLTTFTPSTIPWDERGWDIAMLGVMYPRRQALANRLMEAGFKVYAQTGLVYEEYAHVYQNARISLCASAAGDVAQRVFETAAMGCTVLTDMLLDLTDETTNKQLGLAGFFCYQDDDECERQVRALLGDEKALAQFGAVTLQKIVRERHSWEHRCQKVLEWFTKEYGGGMDKLVASDGGPLDGKVSVVNGRLGVGNTRNDDVTIVPTGEIVHPNNSPSNFMPAPHIEIPEDWKAEPPKDGDIIALGGTFGGSRLLRKIGSNEPDYVEHADGTRGKAFLNLGCGRTHFPSAKPAGHELVDDAVYTYPLWVNVDKVDGVGADKVFDLFTYPWPMEDGSFDGAILAHLAEHCPHEIKIAQMPMDIAMISDDDVIDGNLDAFSPELIEKRNKWIKRRDELLQLQDGWYCMWSELFRVLTPNAIVHVVSPYGFSDGGIVDPSHTRYLTMNTFTHSMTPEISDGSTFRYNNGGINFVIDGQPVYRFTPYAEMLKKFYDSIGVNADYAFLMGTHLNVCYDMMVRLKVIK